MRIAKQAIPLSQIHWLMLVSVCCENTCFLMLVVTCILLMLLFSFHTLSRTHSHARSHPLGYWLQWLKSCTDSKINIKLMRQHFWTVTWKWWHLILHDKAIIRPSWKWWQPFSSCHVTKTCSLTIFETFWPNTIIKMYGNKWNLHQTNSNQKF